MNAGFIVNDYYSLLIMIMNVRKERQKKEYRKTKRMNKTEPTATNELLSNSEEESIIDNAKKYLIDINKQLGDDSSFRNYHKLISVDSTLAEWNHRHISSKKQFVNIPERQKRFSLSKEFEISPQAKDLILSKNMNFTCRHKRNSTQIKKKYSLNTENNCQNLSILRVHQSKTKSPIKSIEIKQIDIQLNTPQRQSKSSLAQWNIDINFSSKSSKIIQKKQKQRLARLQRLYGVHAEQHANKYNYIFKSNKSRKFKLPVHSLLTNEINKINKLINQQNSNFNKF